MVGEIKNAGELEIAMEKTDAGRELVIMVGTAISSVGTSAAIVKMGFTPNGLS